MPLQSRYLKINKRVFSSQRWPQERLRKFQERALRKLLVHAARTVPFYQERLRVVVNPDEISSFDIRKFNQIPLLFREDIQKNLVDLTSVSIPEGHKPVSYASTSGSTGKPLTVLSTALTEHMLKIHRAMWMQWCKRDHNATWFYIMDKDEKGTWTHGKASGPLVSFKANYPVDKQIEFLKSVQEAYVTTVPSNLKTLIEYSRKKQLQLPRILGATAMGEAVPDGLRELCLDALGVRLMDSYAAREIGFIASLCPVYDQYHVMTANVFMEVLNDDGSECEPGETGRVVLTTLNNFASPLIRYQINDYAVAGDTCECGRQSPVVRKFLGRNRNMFLTPEGVRYYPIFTEAISDLAREMQVINQVQLLQTSLKEVTVCMVVSEKLKKDQESKVKKVIGAALSGYYTISLEYPDDIPRKPNGKYEDAVCLISD